MSTLAVSLAGLTAPATETSATAGFCKRFIQARQARIDDLVRAHLATTSNADLARLGWTETQVRALRGGHSWSPDTRQGGEVS
jgi:hypothetical protein